MLLLPLPFFVKDVALSPAILDQCLETAGGGEKRGQPRHVISPLPWIQPQAGSPSLNFPPALFQGSLLAVIGMAFGARFA